MRRKALASACVSGERAAALNGLADTLLYFGRVEEGLDCLREAVSLEPTTSLYRMNLAACLIREGKALQGMEALRNTEEAESRNAVYWMWLGRAYQALGRTPEAIEALGRSTALNPNAEHVWRDLAMTLVDAGLYGQAARICARKLQPGLASCLIRADIEGRTGHDAQTCALLREALGAMGGPEAFEEVRWHYCNRRSHEELIAYVRRIASRSQTCPWPHWILARLLSLLADCAAETEVAELLRLEPAAAEQLKTDPFLRRHCTL